MGKAIRFVAAMLVASPLFPAGSAALRADEFRTPAISAVRVEWRAALDQLRSEITSRPTIAPEFTFSGHRHVPAFDPRSMPALVQTNAVTSKIFAGIGRSPVPVLLPFDTAEFLDSRCHGNDKENCHFLKLVRQGW